MKRLVVLLSFFCSIFAAKSQNLTVEGTAPNLYVTHTVAPKENFYSIGRLYNQSPKAIASFNNITMEKGLTIGQRIKIPMSDQNSGGNDNKESAEALIPVTHVVEKGETLFKIGNNYKVTPDDIKKWNNLSSNNIAPGTPLVVGHLKTKGDQPVASTTSAPTPPVKPNVTAPGREVVREPKKVVIQPKTEEPVASSTVDNSSNTRQAGLKDLSANEPNKSAGSAKKEDPFAAVNTGSQAEKKEEVASSPVTINKQKGNTSDALVKDEPVKEAPVKNIAQESSPLSQPAIGYSNSSEASKMNDLSMETGSLAGGAFAGLFSKTTQRSANTKSGEAATFKSTSGWQDKKYYVLMNDVAPGTILKITSNNNKVVYAKVLGNMPEMKENTGLLLRISNSAASSLGIIDPKFLVEVSYYP